MSWLYGKFPPKFLAFQARWGFHAYALVAVFYTLTSFYLLRSQIPANTIHAVLFTLQYALGCLLLFALMPLFYAIAIRQMGKTGFRPAGAVAVIALPLLCYTLSQLTSQSKVPFLQILALPLLLAWLVWPVGYLDTLPWPNNDHARLWRSIGAQALSLAAILLLGAGMTSFNRLEIFQFPPDWYNEPAISDLSTMPTKTPAPEAVAKISPLVQSFLRRQGLTHLRLDKANSFRFNTKMVEFGFLVRERSYQGQLFIIFDLQGNLLSYQLGKAAPP